MGCFGGPTAKPHRLWCNDKALLESLLRKGGYMSRELLATFSTSLVTKYTDRNGVKRYSGKPKELKNSQPLDCNLT